MYLIGGFIGIVAGLIYLFFHFLDFSRKIVLIKGRWTEQRTTAGHDGNAPVTYTVTILDTDQGMLETQSNKFANLEIGSRYLCWVGYFSVVPFMPKPLFLGKPFEKFDEVT